MAKIPTSVIVDFLLLSYQGAAFTPFAPLHAHCCQPPCHDNNELQVGIPPLNVFLYKSFYGHEVSSQQLKP